ncbi:hypothetical protein V491_07739 [Pseudogymnoascus sp. VKM F-3775]|nr:hypothetical protein V491_07739 [Pseudogymnoascus sp. VKM F-3775]
MASGFAKCLTAILGRRQHRKIAIICLRDDAGIDLLKCLCGTIKERRGDKVGQRAYTGTKSSLKTDFDFITVGVGWDQPASYHLWTAAQFHDADGFIWVVDETETDLLLAESQEEMRNARKGRRLDNGLVQAGVSPEAPWLVLLDFKHNPLSIAEAARQAELVVEAAGDDLNWSVCAVSTTTLEGLKEVMDGFTRK